ncbi:MAG TPA: glutamate racemase [Candidatus Paceibacterota bacterium]|nr:glutamate racemase [Candidatus Paceibacterota bacterium]
MKIGIFDSGFGGLDIFGHVKNSMPSYDFIYLGDTARTPYGSRSQETIYKYTEQAVDFLFKKDCQLIILACNTASAEALRKIQQEYLVKNYPDRRVLGVIIPAVEVAVEKSKNKKIGVIATESTVKSSAFADELKKIDQDVQVFQKACPLLVPIVESSEKNAQIINLVIKNYLKELVDNDIDTLILGCTHYGILKLEIQKALSELGSKAVIINEGEIVSQKLQDYLIRHAEIEEKLSKNSSQEFFTTDLTEKFTEIGSILVGEKIQAQKISLE